MSVKTCTTLPTINITCSAADQLSSNQNTKFYNDSSIIKSGILELCHLSTVSLNGDKKKQLFGEQVLVTIYRTSGEYFAIINLLNETGFNASIKNMNELNSNSICVNLKHCVVEKCSNSRFFKLVLNDFTSVILFRVVKPKEQQTHLQAPQTMNNQQSKSLGDLSVINEIDNESDNEKNNQNEETLSWISAFSENRSNEADYLLRANNLSPLTRRQSLQTVIESDEEDEHYNTIH